MYIFNSLSQNNTTMNRNLYIFGIFILGLTIFAGLLHNIVQLLLTYPLELHSFYSWSVFYILLYIAAFTILLKYFYYKKYWLAFTSGILLSFAIIGQSILHLHVYESEKLGKFFMPVTYIALLVGSLYAIILIVSKSRERPWLKTVGIFTFATNLITIFLIIGLVNTVDLQIQNMLQNIGKWITFISPLISIFYILNFWDEIRSLKEVHESSNLQKFTIGSLATFAVITLILLLYKGSEVATECYWKLDWEKRKPEISRKLAEPFENRIFVNSDGDSLQYLLMKPLDYDSHKKYPLVVCLHGGTWMRPPDKPRHILVEEPAAMLSDSLNREKYPAFLFVPQCPSGHSWGGIPNYPGADSLVFETIRALEEEFEIDEKRRYVAGGSGGGMGSWYFIGTRPDMFAAAIPFCGAGNPQLADNMVDVPVWAFHGSKDRNVPASGSRQMVEAIKNAGGNPLYTEFPDVGHHVWPHIQATPGVMDWLFAQKRE